ncbi:MAG: replication-associated recombination protein A [Eubacteriales bacterium]
MYQPLADRLRPQGIEDVCGQQHILKKGAMLRRLIDSQQIPNLIFYGPSGVGKTTVANIIANRTKRKLCRLNATTATSSDIKEVVAQLGTMMAPNGILLYLDEIQYFNKKQQQSLLEHIENGNITLIASTTENPYFYIYNAILSRSTVFEFKPLEAEDVLWAVHRGKAKMEEELSAVCIAEEGVWEHVARSCGGDVRKAMNAVELLISAAEERSGTLYIALSDAQSITQKSAMRYDRDGDSHYDILSAFQKSIRGSDPNAAIHYLARLLEGGDLASPTRRLLVIAAEDIGLAHPQAIAIVKACVDAAFQLGLPEARIPLAEAVIFLATCPKSNSANVAIDLALHDLKHGKTGDIPAHLKDAHYGGAAKLGHGKGYQYPHDFPNHYVEQTYLPDPLKNQQYYQYGDNKIEQLAQKYWKALK